MFMVAKKEASNDNFWTLLWRSSGQAFKTSKKIVMTVAVH